MYISKWKFNTTLLLGPSVTFIFVNVKWHIVFSSCLSFISLLDLNSSFFGMMKRRNRLLLIFVRKKRRFVGSFTMSSFYFVIILFMGLLVMWIVLWSTVENFLIFSLSLTLWHLLGRGIWFLKGLFGLELFGFRVSYLLKFSYVLK